MGRGHGERGAVSTPIAAAATRIYVENPRTILHHKSITTRDFNSVSNFDEIKPYFADLIRVCKPPITVLLKKKKKKEIDKCIRGVALTPIRYQKYGLKWCKTIDKPAILWYTLRYQLTSYIASYTLLYIGMS